MKKLIAASLFLLACGGKTAPTTTPPAATDPVGVTPPTPTPPPAPAYTGKAQIGTFGFDATGMDRSIAPGASFYGYANGTWQTRTQVPDDKSNYGMFTVLADQSDERTKEIIQNAKAADGPEAEKVATYYASFMDEAAIEARGLEPIKADLARIVAIKTQKALV